MSPVDALERALVVHSSMNFLRKSPYWDGFLRLADRTQVQRGFGDFSAYLWVAEGQGEIALSTTVKAWDVAALKVVVEEAGGRLTDLDGRLRHLRQHRLRQQWPAARRGARRDAKGGARVKTFRDRVAVVTGAASGIGLALAERFAAEGMKVVMADIEAAALATAAEGLRRKGAAVLATRVDVSRPEDVERLARETYDAFGAAHVLCNNAGVAVIGAVHEHTLADWQWVINVNLWGVIHGVRAFLPRMLAGGDEGHIVNTASMAGLTTAPFMSVYDVTKHGVVALSESMYKEFQVTGAPIGVSVLCPGLINTNIMRSSRNRPAGPRRGGQGGPDGRRPSGRPCRIGSAGGYPPSEVAEQVVQGIREGRFYIVPAQPEVKSGIAVRAQDLLELRNPTLRRG